MIGVCVLCVLLVLACAFVRSYDGVGRCSPGVACRAILVGLPCVGSNIE